MKNSERWALEACGKILTVRETMMITRSTNKEMMKETNEFTSNDILSNVRYLTYIEVAKILRCSERTIHNRVRNGDIVPHRNGRLVLFTQQCIDEFLNRQSKLVTVTS